MGGRGAGSGGGGKGAAVNKLNALYRRASANPTPRNQAAFQRAHQELSAQGGLHYMAGSDSFAVSNV